MTVTVPPPQAPSPADHRTLRGWLMRGPGRPGGRRTRGRYATAPSGDRTARLVEGDVPDRRRLLLDAGLPARASPPLAAGVLSPFATLVLVAAHRCSARCRSTAGSRRRARTARARSRCSSGCCSFWKGKLFVLVLLGFAATDFLITMTLSAADADGAHRGEPATCPALLHGHEVAITLVLLALLGGVFLRGFTEAIGIAVALVARLPRAQRGRDRGVDRHVVAAPAASSATGRRR